MNKKDEKINTNAVEANNRIIQVQKKKVRELSSMIKLLKPCMAADNLISSLLEQVKTFVRRKKVLEGKITTADKLMAEGKFASARKEFLQILKIQTKIFDVQGEFETASKIKECEKEIEKKGIKKEKKMRRK